MKDFIFYELNLARKNRWIAGFSALFAVLSGLLLYVSVYTYGGGGHEGFSREISSLLNLSIYIIPILSLLLGSVSVAGDHTDGMFTLLRSIPLSVRTYLWGKFLGLSLSLSIAIFLGYGVGGLLFSLFIGEADLSLFLLFLLVNLALAYIYMAIGCLLGSIVSSRIQAIFSSLVIWFFSVLVYGMLMVVILPFLPFTMMKSFAIAMIALNPADLLRVIFVMAIGDGGVYGPLFYTLSSVMKNGFSLLAVFAGILLVWVGIPLVIGRRYLERREGRG
ncbi:ABC transporter permease [Brevibacillus sp. SYSU BS000544]|uniref:ABC transporter permease n=1 Tax=Brevibacillus sp. SYSU BS000544 TaxID=3416443 RepID=UPI003CE4D371